MPDIANGMVSSGDSAPYFINEMITYVCNNNYDADGMDLTNQCMENSGDIVDPAAWSRMTADLTSVCRAGIWIVLSGLLILINICFHSICCCLHDFHCRCCLKSRRLKSHLC